MAITAKAANIPLSSWFDEFSSCDDFRKRPQLIGGEIRVRVTDGRAEGSGQRGWRLRPHQDVDAARRPMLVEHVHRRHGRLDDDRVRQVPGHADHGGLDRRAAGVRNPDGRSDGIRRALPESPRGLRRHDCHGPCAGGIVFGETTSGEHRDADNGEVLGAHDTESGVRPLALVQRLPAVDVERHLRQELQRRQHGRGCCALRARQLFRPWRSRAAATAARPARP